MPNRWEGQERLIHTANTVTIERCNAEFNTQIPSLNPRGICHLLCKIWSDSVKNNRIDDYFSQLELITEPNLFSLEVLKILKTIHSPPIDTKVIFSYEKPVQSMAEFSGSGLDQKNCLTQLEDTFKQENTLVISVPIHSIGMHKTSTNQFIVFDPNENSLSEYEMKMGGKVFDTLENAIAYLYKSFSKVYNNNRNEFYFEFYSTYLKPADDIEILFNAIKFGEVEEFLNLINQENVGKLHSNLSLLEFTIMWDRPEFIPILLKYGVDPKKTNSEGESVLELASSLTGELFINTKSTINYLLDQNFPIEQVSKSLAKAIESNNIPAIEAFANYADQLKNVEDKITLIEDMVVLCSNNNNETCLKGCLSLGMNILLSIEDYDLSLTEKLNAAWLHLAAIQTSDADFMTEFSLKLVMNFLDMTSVNTNPMQLHPLKIAMNFITQAIARSHPNGLPYFRSFVNNILDECSDSDVLELCRQTLITIMEMKITSKSNTSLGFFSPKQERHELWLDIEELAEQLNEKISGNQAGLTQLN
ncbi:hypothetical protein ACQUW5_08820 [Legionella sp. CNM-1927-20]|uniref:hypothetical protein n=1 Tax=Legionella sp. CNM-1927-20 TaxID=3422221 RepID=UPI00403AF371